MISIFYDTRISLGSSAIRLPCIRYFGFPVLYVLFLLTYCCGLSFFDRLINIYRLVIGMFLLIISQRYFDYYVNFNIDEFYANSLLKRPVKLSYIFAMS